MNDEKGNFLVSVRAGVCMLSCFSLAQLVMTLWTLSCQALLSMGFSRQKNGVGCHASLQGIFPTQGLKSVSCGSCIPGGFFTAEPHTKYQVKE